MREIVCVSGPARGSVARGRATDPASPLLGIDPDKRQFKMIYASCVHWKHCSQQPRHRKPKCSPTDEWLEKLWYIYCLNMTQFFKRMKQRHLKTRMGLERPRYMEQVGKRKTNNVIPLIGGI